jgi:hypothetical protein
MDLIDEIFLKSVIDLIKTQPNDMILGEKVRRVYYGLENTKNNEIEKGNDSSLRGGQESRDDN